MAAAILHGTDDMQAESVPDLTIEQSADALLRSARSCACAAERRASATSNADLPMLAEADPTTGGHGKRSIAGHEYAGEVAAVGEDAGDWMLGASTVIATTRSADERELLMDLGADVVVVTGEGDLTAAVLDATVGKGADEVLDHVAGDIFAQCLLGTAVDGNVVRIGRLAGPVSAIVLATALVLTGCTTSSPPAAVEPGNTARAPQETERTLTESVEDVALRLRVNGIEARAAMVDNATARHFAALLPLTVQMRDMLGREAYGSGLPEELTHDAPRRTDYEAGELVYWPPTNGIAVCYRVAGDPVPEPGLIPLGRITDGIEGFELAGGPAEVTIEGFTDLDPTEGA